MLIRYANLPLLMFALVCLAGLIVGWVGIYAALAFVALACFLVLTDPSRHPVEDE